MQKAYLSLLFAGLSVCSQNAWRPLGRDVMNQISPEGQSGLLEVYNNTPYVFTESKLSAFIAGQWQHISPELPAGITAKDFVFDTAGIPVIAATANNTQNVSVMRLVSGAWQNIGNQILPVGAANNIMLAVSPSNDIYIAYSENSNAYDFLIKKFDGSNWINVGNIAALDLSLVLKKLEFGADGKLYFAGNQLYNMLKPTVKRLNGNTWENVGTEFTLSTWISDFEVAANGDAFLMFEDQLFKFDGQWTQMLQLTAAETLGEINIGSDSLLYMTYKTPGFIDIDKFVGSNRVTVATYPTTLASELETELDSNNNSIIAYLGMHGLNVIRGTSGVFTQLGNEGMCPDDYYYSGDLMEIEPHHNTPYVAQVIRDINYNYKTVISKFDGTDWIQVGAPLEGVNPMRLLFDHWDRPCLLVGRYFQGDVYKKILRFSGSQWDEIIPEQLDLFDMGLGTDGSLYLSMFRSVKKFDGTNWNYLGEPIVSDFSAIYKIYVGTDNIPRILVYTYTSEGISWQLQKLVGNSWQNVGEPFTTLSSELKTLLDDNNVFYYMSTDTNLGVMRLNGNQYEMLGQPNFDGIDNIATTTPSFAVDHNGTPYVLFTQAYQDPLYGWINGYLSAYKFDGSSWVNIEDNVVDVFIDSPILRINNNNQPVTIFTKNGGFYGVYYGDDGGYPLGLPQNTMLSNIVAYPNPVSQVLHLKTEKVIEHVAIFDMTGKQIMSQTSNQKNIAVETIAPGMYLAKIKSGSKTTTVKFVKI